MPANLQLLLFNFFQCCCNLQHRLIGTTTRVANVLLMMCEGLQINKFRFNLCLATLRGHPKRRLPRIILERNVDKATGTTLGV